MSLDTDNWDLLQALFHLAEETAPEGREGALMARCANPDLVRRAMEFVDDTELLERDTRLSADHSRPGRMELPSLPETGLKTAVKRSN